MKTYYCETLKCHWQGEADEFVHNEGTDTFDKCPKCGGTKFFLEDDTDELSGDAGLRYDTDEEE